MIPLRLYQLLEAYTDAEHWVSQQQLVRLLKEHYGIKCERKTIARNICCLRRAGYDISASRKGIFLAKRRFSSSEVKMLIDSVITSDRADENLTRQLIEKLEKEGGKFFPKSMEFVFCPKRKPLCSVSRLFENIEIISGAIQNKSKIRFAYLRYDFHKKLVPEDGSPFTASPYKMLAHDKRYYLVCNTDDNEEISYLRLDKMNGITLIEEPTKPLKALGMRNGLCLNSMCTRLPYEFEREAKRVVIRCKQCIMDELIDSFGTDFSVKLLDCNRMEVCLKAGISAMKRWLMIYGEYAEVIFPPSLRNSISETVKYMHAVYNRF